MNQLSLDLAPLARRYDPPTSHAAASAAVEFRAEHHALILDALRQGNAGKTEIACRSGIDHIAVARRLPELERLGLVTTTGRTATSAAGRAEREWRACA